MSMPMSRRSLLASSAAIAATGFAGSVIAQSADQAADQVAGAGSGRGKTPPKGTLQANSASDVAPQEPDFQYSVQKTEAEWRAQLSEAEYKILRDGKTEKKKSSPLWKEDRSGTYRCKACDLLIYTSKYKVVLNKGWVFFRQSEPDSILMGIDLVTSYGWREKNGTAMEVHCRRCGSHFGHILNIKGEILNCVNGAALRFEPA